MNKLNIKPITDRVWVLPDMKETSESGFDLPDEAQQKQPSGIVVAVGNGKYAPQTGVLIPMAVNVGDKVYFSPHAGAEIRHDGEVYLVMHQEDLIAVLCES